VVLGVVCVEIVVAGGAFAFGQGVLGLVEAARDVIARGIGRALQGALEPGLLGAFVAIVG
jgi:hypothetical protein